MPPAVPVLVAVVADVVADVVVDVVLVSSSPQAAVSMAAADRPASNATVVRFTEPSVRRSVTPQ